MRDAVIQIEGVSKQYRLGEVGTGTLHDDLTRAWYRLRGKADPYAKIGSDNDRTHRGDSDYVWALRDLDFDIRRGETIGIIGRNGAGKSTLLKILSRVTAPSKGCFRSKGQIASLLEVGTGFHPDLTGRENVYLNGAIMGMNRTQVTRRLDDIVGFSGCERYIDTPVKRYSSGMTVRLGFAVAAHLEPDILVVDEVLAVGDVEFQKRCIGKMQDVAARERTVLFVSHNMANMRRLCERGILLHNGRLQASGPMGSVIEQYLASGQQSDRVFQFKESEHRLRSDMKIEAMELLIPGARDAFLLGEPIPIALRVTCTDAVDCVRVGIGLMCEGVRICTVHSEPIDFKAGTTHVKCTLPKNVLLPGHYALVVGAHSARDGRAFDYVTREVPMQVAEAAAEGGPEHDMRAQGLIQLDSTWESMASASVPSCDDL